MYASSRTRSIRLLVLHSSSPPFITFSFDFPAKSPPSSFPFGLSLYLRERTSPSSSSPFSYRLNDSSNSFFLVRATEAGPTTLFAFSPSFPPLHCPPSPCLSLSPSQDHALLLPSQDHSPSRRHRVPGLRPCHLHRRRQIGRCSRPKRRDQGRKLQCCWSSCWIDRNC